MSSYNCNVNARNENLFADTVAVIKLFLSKKDNSFLNKSSDPYVQSLIFSLSFNEQKYSQADKNNKQILYFFGDVNMIIWSVFVRYWSKACQIFVVNLFKVLFCLLKSFQYIHFVFNEKVSQINKNLTSGSKAFKRQHQQPTSRHNKRTHECLYLKDTVKILLSTPNVS